MPIGAEYLIDGLFYKIGRNHFAFYHNGIEWLKSFRSNNDVTKFEGTSKDLAAMGAKSRTEKELKS